MQKQQIIFGDDLFFQSKYWERFPMLQKLSFGLRQVLTHYLHAKD
ncbi:hypothetical protein [Orbus sasakiae]